MTEDELKRIEAEGCATNGDFGDLAPCDEQTRKLVAEIRRLRGENRSLCCARDAVLKGVDERAAEVRRLQVIEREYKELRFRMDGLEK